MLTEATHDLEETRVERSCLNDAAAQDAEVVFAAKGGSSRAFEILVGRYRGRILRVAQRFTRNREDAEDVVQQTFQKAFLYLHKFEGKSSFSTWLTRIAINEALMLVRRGRLLREIPSTTETGMRKAQPHWRSQTQVWIPKAAIHRERKNGFFQRP